LKTDVLVIGGGVAGLIAARAEALAGSNVILLEKLGVLGGQVRAADVAGIRVDVGAEAFSTVTPAFSDFLHGIGLSNQIVDPRGISSHVLTDSGKHPIPRGVFGIPADLSDPALEFLGAETLAEAAVLDEAPLDFDVDTITVGELVSRRLGQRFLNELVAPVIAGVHGSNASELEAKSLFPALVDQFRSTGSLVLAAKNLRGQKPSPGTALASLKGGMSGFTEFLGQSLINSGVEILLGKDVSDVRKKLDNTWLILTDDLEFEANRIIIATDAKTAAAVLSSFSELSKELSEVEASSAVIATVLVESQELNYFPLGNGALVSKSVGVPIRATTHLNAKWDWLNQELQDNLHLVRLSFEIDAPEAQFDCGEIERLIQTLYGVDSVSVRDVVVTKWPSSLVKFTSGHSARVSKIQDLARAEGIELVGAYLTGNGLAGLVKNVEREAHGV
jgi:oxygen-dependent protoporphyrinogen oxidase